MRTETLRCWGRYPYRPQLGHEITWPDELPRALQEAKVDELRTLPFGNGRSYGDSCLAESDRVLWLRGMDRILAADWENGVVRAQAGLLLSELIDYALPRGWFLPVTPGTKYVTVGGAVANDVHGKNHHVMGTFGRHVQRIALYRSDEGVIECGPEERPDLFAATVGGLGLSGVILWVELQLRPVQSSEIEMRSIRFDNLDEFFELAETYDKQHEYTVAWIDCLARGSQLGRGHYLIGEHAQEGTLTIAARRSLTIPVDPPVSLVNRLSLRLFNTLYYHRQQRREVKSRVSYEPYFYPLDALLEWNRMYGRKGFQQYQCIVPEGEAHEVMREILQAISRSGTGSFLAVLKRCGAILSPGLLSFPMLGTSLALDFPQHEPANRKLFARLDKLVHEAGGRLYPAKDAHMRAEDFQSAYPRWEEVEQRRDPALMSQFWKRVTP